MIPKLVPADAGIRRAAPAARRVRRPSAPMIPDCVRNPTSAAELGAPAAGLPRTHMYLGAPGTPAADTALPARGADTAGPPEPAPSTAAGPVPPVRVAPPDRSPSFSTPSSRKA